MAKDPICGMTVNEATAISAERDGQKFYFCSEHCRQKFLAQPATVASASQTPLAHHVAENHSGSGRAEQPPQPMSFSSHHKASGVKGSPTAKYFCPMCPGVESDKPGACPKCGMALELNPAWQPPKKVIYTCPMHPEIEQDHPGTCPKCGMALETEEPSQPTQRRTIPNCAT